MFKRLGAIGHARSRARRQSGAARWICAHGAGAHHCIMLRINTSLRIAITGASASFMDSGNIEGVWWMDAP